MTRAIITAVHAYTPFGQGYYQPLLDFQLNNLQKYQDEWDHLYLVEDDNWKLEIPEDLKGRATIIHVDSSKRYYDAYKEVLPQIKEDLVLLLDDDLIVYKEGVIKNTFYLLDGDAKHLYSGKFWGVVSITDTIGTMKVPLKTGNKLCPYFFATRKDLLMKYLDVDWGPDAMPYTETFGLLTEAMLKDGARVYEMEDDKTEVTNWNPLETEKTLGYYHVRAGSTAAYLLATKYYGDIKTYNDYLKNQPSAEIIRHCGWYEYMGGDPRPILDDLAAMWEIKGLE